MVADGKVLTPEILACVWLLPILSWLVSNGHFLLLMTDSGVVQEGGSQPQQPFILPSPMSPGLAGDGSAKDPLFYLQLSVCPQQRDPALEAGSRL